ncbi:hypothetical protein [Cohaesibacter intestini]|uniref:hypothetical protein n=1 Tax=Cohaesibacter intestini TaxID=2211145 RepID=UPI000DE9B4DD|nr:hypothetical protein [Cohaesibacter intestini]
MKRHALSLSFLLISTSLVQAQSDAEKAFQAMIDDVNASGWLTVEVGSTHYQADKDLLTAQNVVYKLNWSLPETGIKAANSTTTDATENGTAENDDLTIDLEITVPSMTGAGFALKEDGITYDSIIYEGITFDVTLDAEGTASDMQLKARALGKDQVSNGFQPFVGEFKIAPSRPIGSFLDYIRPILTKPSYEEYSSDGYVMTQFAPDGAAIEEREIGPITLTDFANGRIGSMEMAYQKGKISVVEPGKETNDDLPFDQVTFEAGKTVYEGYDMAALWAAIDPGMPPIEGTRDVVKVATTENMSFSAKGFFTATLGPSTQKDLTVKQPASYIVPLLDKMISQDQKPDKMPPEDQKALIKAGFDLARSFSYGLGEVKDIQFSGTIPEGDMSGQTVEAKLSSMRIADINKDGIGEMSVSGFDFTGPVGVSAAFDRFAIENLEFPNYAHIETVIDKGLAGEEPTPAESAKLAPNAIKMVLNGLKVRDPSANMVSANQILIETKKQGLAIPTLIKTRISDLSVPKDLIQHPMVSVLMTQLNMERLLVNEDITLRWDEASESIKLDPLNIELADIAKLDGSINFGGILRAYLDDPEQAQAAIATGTVLPSSLTLTNLGGIDEMINMAGGFSGMGPDQVRSFAESQIQAILSAFTKPDFAQMVAGEVKAFLANPDNITILLKPGAPVPVAQLLGAASQAPHAIPDILKIGVTANQ